MTSGMNDDIEKSRGGGNVVNQKKKKKKRRGRVTGFVGRRGWSGDTRLMYLRGKIGFNENKAQAGAQAGR